jgi:hypothetical protein
VTHPARPRRCSELDLPDSSGHQPTLKEEEADQSTHQEVQIAISIAKQSDGASANSSAISIVHSYSFWC